MMLKFNRIIFLVGLLLTAFYIQAKQENQIITGVPTISINNVTMTEGNVGTKQFDFTISIDFLTASSTVDVVTADGTATSSSGDYIAISTPPNIEFSTDDGALSKTFSVTVNGDTTFEGDETFFVNLSNVSGAVLGNTQGIGTITNDDLPEISIDDVTQNEGNSGTSTFDFTVSISASANATVSFSTTDGTATVADSDYQPTSSIAPEKLQNPNGVPALPVVFTAGGATSQTVSVIVNGDTKIEADETFELNLSNATGATIVDGQGIGTIVNDDTAAISVSDVSLAEGDAGSSNFDFTVSIDNSADATVQVSTSDGTATTADSDYDVLMPQTVTFTSGGVTTQTVSVSVNGDVAVESDETFNVNLSNVTGNSVSIADSLGIGTIINDDTIQAIILNPIKSVSGDLTPGGLIRYEIVMTNSGPNIQNDNPGDEMTDVLPALLQFISVTATSGTPSNVGNTVSWNGSIPPSGSVTVTINASINTNASGTIANQAEAFFDSNGDNTNDSSALSNGPITLGPTVFSIPITVPSTNIFGLVMLILMINFLLLYLKKKNVTP